MTRKHNKGCSRLPADLRELLCVGPVTLAQTCSLLFGTGRQTAALHICWHCVACIALLQADANTFFIIDWAYCRDLEKKFVRSILCLLVVLACACRLLPASGLRSTHSTSWTWGTAVAAGWFDPSRPLTISCCLPRSCRGLRLACVRFVEQHYPLL